MTAAERERIRLAVDAARRSDLPLAGRWPTRAERARRRRLRSAIASDGPISQTRLLFGVLTMLAAGDA